MFVALSFSFKLRVKNISSEEEDSYKEVGRDHPFN